MSAWMLGLNAPTGAWCSLTPGSIPTLRPPHQCLNAPTGAWCSLTGVVDALKPMFGTSQCTYRCVVLPDVDILPPEDVDKFVSMHLQVRGAP